MSMKLRRLGAIGICLVMMLLVGWVSVLSIQAVFAEEAVPEAAQETTPTEGRLLMAGDIQAAQSQEDSQGAYINSTVDAKGLGILCASKVLPALEKDAQKLSIYAYGSGITVNNGGCGVYIGPFNSFYAYGSSVKAAEIGLISDTCGDVLLSTIQDGEANEELAEVLSNKDKGAQANKQLGTTVEGGRNALMVQSTDIELSEEYQEYLFNMIPEEYQAFFSSELSAEYQAEKYQEYLSQALALLQTNIDAHDSTLKTDLTIDNNVTYKPQEQAYIDHTKGSVILIKSTNAALTLDSCKLLPDKDGTGYLIQTVVSNDTATGFAVPDGKTYPGIFVLMKDMAVTGDIAHEDYQRDLYLELKGTTYTGAINQYSFSQWQAAAQKEGFEDYCTDESYKTHHGAYVTLANDSVWNVTEDSYLAGLVYEPGCKINGIIYYKGKEYAPGKMSLFGDIVVKPLPHVHTWYAAEVVDQTCVTDGYVVYQCTGCEESYTDYYPATGHNYYVAAYVEPECETDGYIYYACAYCGDGYTEPLPATGHDWQQQGGNPPTCTFDGNKNWVCTKCGAEYLETEVGSALGHDWVFTFVYGVTCTEDGYEEYTCSRCGEKKIENFQPATGHNLEYWYNIEPTCVDYGYSVWICLNCYDTFKFTNAVPYGKDGEKGHHYVFSGYVDSKYHYYVCEYCGKYQKEEHQGNPCIVCGHTS